MVNKVFRLIFKEVQGLHKAAYVLAVFTISSQVLALVRDRLLAHIFGPGDILDLYNAAFRIPDVLFALFASVLSVYVLLPFVTEAEEKRKKENSSGSDVLGQMFTLFLIVYLVVALLVFIFAPLLVTWFFPGLIAYNETLVSLLRILLLQPFLLGISSLVSVVTQWSRRFILFALSPIIYNIGIIFGILVLYPEFGLQGLVSGVVLGALGHLMVQLPLLKQTPLLFGLVRKFDLRLLKNIFSVAIPRALTLSTQQVVFLVLTGIATVMKGGSISVFQFAFNLQSVPLAIIGASYSVAAFPTLANLIAQGKREVFNLHILVAVRHIIFWSLPIVALVIVLRAQIVRVLLGSGAFGWNDTRLTAAMLALFILSLVAQSVNLLLVRAFYAGGFSKLPLITALTGGGTTIISAYFLLERFGSSSFLQNSLESVFRLKGVVGTEVFLLAVAFVLGTFVQMVLLIIFINNKFAFKWTGIREKVFNSFLAALMAGASAYATLIFIVDGINQETFMGIFLQGLIAGIVGIFGAFLVYRALKSEEMSEIYDSLKLRVLKIKIFNPKQE